MSDNQNDPGMDLIGHLTELRVRLIRILIILLVSGVLCWIFSEQLFTIIRAPIMPYLKSTGLVFTNPIDKFMAHLKVSIISGVIFSTPLWLYQVWAFVAPGLYQHEKKISLAFIVSGSVLFLIGVCFVYFLVLGKAFEFLFTFGGSEDTPMITIDNYLSFFTTMVLAFGAAFEMPLILVVLGMFGIIDASFLRKQRRFAIVIMAIVAAVVTPPDIMSMLLLLGPMMVLYEGSIVLVSILGKRNAGLS